jgi:hypothetical protein
MIITVPLSFSSLAQAFVHRFLLEFFNVATELHSSRFAVLDTMVQAQFLGTVVYHVDMYILCELAFGACCAVLRGPSVWHLGWPAW